MLYSMSPVQPRVSARPAAGPPKPPRNKWARCPQESAAVQNRTCRHWLYTSLWFSRWQEWGLPTGVGIAWPPHACKEYPRWETLWDSRFIRSLLKKKKNTNTCGENTGLRWPALFTLGWTSVRAVSWAGRFRGEWTRAWITQPGRGLLPGRIVPIDETDLSSENQLDILKHIDLFISEDGFFLWLLSGWRMGWFYQPMLCRGFKAQFLGNRLSF